MTGTTPIYSNTISSSGVVGFVVGRVVGVVCVVVPFV